MAELELGSDGGDSELTKVKLSRPPLEESEMDITPMIDCTFLLLIFFIVCGRINQESQITTPQARNGVVMPAREAVVLTVMAGSAPTAMVYKGDGPITDNLISNADPTLQEQEISRYVESTMRTEQKTAILIKAERKVKHREISRVIKAATQGLELSKIHVAVQQSG
jgi:biopolymer transport protein ExbD